MTAEEKAAKVAEKEAKAKAAADAAAAGDDGVGPEPTPEVPAVAPKAAATAKVVRKAHWPKEFTPTGDVLVDTKALLDLSPKVMFMVPLAADEKPGAEEIVQINGHKYTIKKGNMVEVPRPVMELLATKYRVEMEVAMRASAYANPKAAAALSPDAE